MSKNIFYPAKSEPTGPLDWITFAMCIIVSVIQSISMIIYLIKRRSYTPLRTKNFTYLYLCHIFGLVMIWSTFISNTHISDWNTLKNDTNCVFWSFWLEYFIGFALFYLCLVQHVGGIAFIGAKDAMLYFVRILIFSFSIVPPLVMFSWITHTDGCSFSIEYNTCVTKIQWKIALVVWLSMCMILLHALIIILRKNELIKDENVSEYKALFHISIFILYVFIVNVPLNIFGMLAFEWGRSIYTINIVLLNIFIHTKLITYRLYKSLINDREYVVEIMNSSELINIDVNTIVDMEHNKDKMKDFLVWIVDNAHILSIPRVNTTGEIISAKNSNKNMMKNYELLTINESKPLNYVQAYNGVVDLLKKMDQRFLLLEYKEDPYAPFVSDIESMMTFYFNDNAYQQIILNDKTLIDDLRSAIKSSVKLTRILIVRLKFDIVKTMDNLWGQTYLKFDNIQMEKIKHAKQKTLEIKITTSNKIEEELESSKES